MIGCSDSYDVEPIEEELETQEIKTYDTTKKNKKFKLALSRSITNSFNSLRSATNSRPLPNLHPEQQTFSHERNCHFQKWTYFLG